MTDDDTIVAFDGLTERSRYLPFASDDEALIFLVVAFPNLNGGSAGSLRSTNIHAEALALDGTRSALKRFDSPTLVSPAVAGPHLYLRTVGFSITPNVEAQIGAGTGGRYFDIGLRLRIEGCGQARYRTEDQC